MEEKHRIIIQNIENNKTFSHSLIFLKGTVENVALNCNFQKLTSIVISDKKTQTCTVECKNNDFKYFVELELGENRIKINCNCFSIEIVTFFTPKESKYTVLPLYIVCKKSDGKFQSPNETNSIENGCKRIILGCKVLQLIFAELIEMTGYNRKTFTLNSSDKNIFYSQLSVKEAREKNQDELWRYFANEIMTSSLGNSCTKYIAFLSCTRYKNKSNSPNKIFDSTEAYVAFGGGGLALLGTACLYTWPEDISEILSRFQDFTTVDKTQFMDDSCFRGTLGGCFSTTLGSALHELCHTFDLGHTDKGIMGRGFNNIQDFFLKDDTKLKERNNHIFNDKRGDYDFYFTTSCSSIINYHKWFNNYESKSSTFQFDENLFIIKSVNGIRVIEVRTADTELVTNFWIFDKKVLKYQFQIPLNEKLKTGPFVIFSIDNQGNNFKYLYELNKKNYNK